MGREDTVLFLHVGTYFPSSSGLMGKPYKGPLLLRRPRSPPPAPLSREGKKSVVDTPPPFALLTERGLLLFKKMVDTLADASSTEQRLLAVSARLREIERRKGAVDDRQDNIDRLAFETIATMVDIQVSNCLASSFLFSHCASFSFLIQGYTKFPRLRELVNVLGKGLRYLEGIIFQISLCMHVN